MPISDTVYSLMTVFYGTYHVYIAYITIDTYLHMHKRNLLAIINQPKSISGAHQQSKINIKHQ